MPAFLFSIPGFCAHGRADFEPGSFFDARFEPSPGFERASIRAEALRGSLWRWHCENGERSCSFEAANPFEPFFLNSSKTSSKTNIPLDELGLFSLFLPVLAHRSGHASPLPIQTKFPLISAIQARHPFLAWLELMAGVCANSAGATAPFHPLLACFQPKSSWRAPIDPSPGFPEFPFLGEIESWVKFLSFHGANPLALISRPYLGDRATLSPEAPLLNFLEWSLAFGSSCSQRFALLNGAQPAKTLSAMAPAFTPRVISAVLSFGAPSLIESMLEWKPDETDGPCKPWVLFALAAVQGIRDFGDFMVFDQALFHLPEADFNPERAFPFCCKAWFSFHARNHHIAPKWRAEAFRSGVFRLKFKARSLLIPESVVCDSFCRWALFERAHFNNKTSLDAKLLSKLELDSSALRAQRPAPFERTELLSSLRALFPDEEKHLPILGGGIASALILLHEGLSPQELLSAVPRWGAEAQEMLREKHILHEQNALHSILGSSFHSNTRFDAQRL